jgi:HlyD family secretion protein
MKKQIIIPIVLAIVGTGAFLLYRHFASRPKPITLYGNVDIRDVSLSFRVSGRVTDIMVDEGDTVEADDVLATLDMEPLQNAADAANATLSSISARNALIHRGNRSEDIAQASAKVEAAKAALTNAKQQYTRYSELLPGGFVSQDSVDTLEAARDQAAANLRAAEELYNALNVGFRSEEKAESDALLKQAQANADTAQLAIRDATLRAPSSGIIMSRAVEKGSMVQAGAAAFSLSLTDPVWVRAYVDEPQLGHFNTGTKVLLYTDSRPGQPYQGTVGFVSPTAEFTPKSVETADLRTALVYRIRIVVNDPDAMLRQGMPVTVKRAE